MVKTEGDAGALVELTDETLSAVSGGDDANMCTVLGGLGASAVGFALVEIGLATAGWGALAGVGLYLGCSAGSDAPLGNLSDYPMADAGGWSGGGGWGGGGGGGGFDDNYDVAMC